MEGYIGNFKVRVNKKPAGEERELEVGAIIVATGYDLFDARLKPEYGYGIYPNVITGLELERMDEAGGPTGGKILVNGKEPQNVVFIQCVGSRDKSVGVEYCSRVCCMYTAKQALYLKHKIPDARVTVCYIDIRAFGKGHEEFYERVQGEGVIYRRGVVSEVYRRGEKLVVRAEDTLLGEAYQEEADLVVLATGLRANRGTAELARVLNISTGADGFFLEAHPKLGPVETATDGIYLAGCCQGPKDITDAVAQGHAAAVKASIPLLLGRLKKPPLVAAIDEEVCAGCRLCESACEYAALVFDERTQVMTVNEVLCRGCGACSARCPSGANQLKNCSKKQLFEMITELV
ncbi:MAG: 4Fe-4S dicluster domain-containing protein [Chloroflexota bacterium]